jgi:DNA-binding GntR family transcriptional regulator
LRRQIVLNERTPGTVLTELALAAAGATSQAAVREALLRLEGEGLVTRAGRRGTTVTQLEPHEAAEMLGLRRRIETRAAAQVVQGAGAGCLARLRELVEDMNQAAREGDVWAMVEADIAFHLELFRPSGLEAMVPILERCILHTQRFNLWAPWHQRPLEQTASRHLLIIDALAAKDSSELRRRIGDHIDTIVEKPGSDRGSA